MAGITYFVALPFDVADGSVVVGEPIECHPPQPRQSVRKVFGKCWATQAPSRSAALVILLRAISTTRLCCELL
jgi:hypothetical protein